MMPFAETKLLTKTIALARLYASKYHIHCGKNASVRFRLLLLSLLQVLKAIGGVEKLLVETDRYIELVKLSSQFDFTQAAQLVQDPRWPIFVQQKIHQHKLRGYLNAWKSFTVRKKRNANVLSKTNNGLISKPALRMKEHPAKDPFIKWRANVRAKLIAIFGVGKKSWKEVLFSTWKKCAHLERIYQNYMGYYCDKPKEFNNLPEREKARFVFREWRGATKLQYRHVCNSLNDRRSTLILWRKGLHRNLGMIHLASIYDSTRLAKPALYFWLVLFNRHTSASKTAVEHFRKAILEKYFDDWCVRRKTHIRLKQTMEKWHSLAQFQCTSRQTAISFYCRKIATVSFSLWRRATGRIKYMSAGADTLELRYLRSQSRIFLSAWRQANRWVYRNEEKIQALRITHKVQSYLRRWRQWRYHRQCADFFYKNGILRKNYVVWRERLQAIHQLYHIRADTFASWRRVLATFRAIKLFAIKKSIPRLISLNHLPVASSFAIWRHRTRLCRTVELYKVKKHAQITANCLKSWRLDANVQSFLQQKPWRSKRRTFRKMRAFLGKAQTRKERLNKGLMEHLQGRQFILYYQGFERWQQIFQAHKMEEHLCSQNLLYYQHRKRQQILRLWHLCAAHRLLDHLKRLRFRKTIFKNWHRDSSASLGARDHRIKARALWKWRQSYRTSIVKDLLKQGDRKLVRLMLVKWRCRAVAQQKSHRNSIEFIGLSSLRYMLQKWRLETNLRRACIGKCTG